MFRVGAHFLHRKNGQKIKPEKAKDYIKNKQQKSLWEIRHQRFKRHTCTSKTRCVQKNISSQLMAETTHTPTMEMKNYYFHKQHQKF